MIHLDGPADPDLSNALRRSREAQSVGALGGDTAA